MKYRTLGRTGLAISEIGFGCGTSAGLMVGGPPEARLDIAGVEALIDSGTFDSIILNYSILNQSAWLDGPTLNPLFTYGRLGARAAQRGMGTVALRTLEAGALATGFDRHPLAAGPGAPDYARYIEQARTLRFLADDGEPTLVAAAIRFGLSNPGVSTVLVGISDITHVDAAADAAARGPLDAAQLRRVETLRAAGFV